MIDDAMLGLPPEPELTPEEQAERDILAQSDAVELVMREAQGIGTIVWTAVESAKLGKRVTTVQHYVELMDGAELIGRQGAGSQKRVGKAGVNVAERVAQVTGKRKRGE